MPRIQCYERSHIWRNNRDDVRQHPCRVGFRIQECFNQFQLLNQCLALCFRFCFLQFRAQTCAFIAHVQVGNNAAHAFGPDTDVERIRTEFFNRILIFVFADDIILFQVRQPRFNNDVCIIRNNLFQFFLGQIVKQGRNLAFAQEPGVRHRHGQFDMPHAFTTNGRRTDFDPATFADNATEFDSFIFSAGTFIILDRAENLLTEQPLRLRL